ncbi:MAG TPA: glycosyltransferase family 2 protein, partial [Thermoanaerobaculia bacterium]
MTGPFAETPSVSVVIPCYNLGSYLDEAVQSVLDQTFGDLEIVVVDDGSTDPATRHLFTSYQRPRTRVFRTENRGLARARNLGIAEARGRYVSCLDADDLLEPTFLERTVAVLEANADVAFASCWLTAFGDARFEWQPASCDFPHLLAEDTVCTAALTRREAFDRVGGFDPAMPVAGYEDWDLAIGLVESGLAGRIVPESLFRYRIRGGSMHGSCREPANHARLFAYIVDKHADSYRRNVSGVIETIERRARELETWRPAAQPGPAPETPRRTAFLEGTLRAVLESKTWRKTRPARRLLDSVKASGQRGTASPARRPRLSVVITVRDRPDALAAAFESAGVQTSVADEVLFVDDGSTDPITRHLLDGYRASGFGVVETRPVGAAAARAAGLAKARGRFLFAMSAGETVGPGALPAALEALDGDPSLSFVLPGITDADRAGFEWTPSAADLPGVLSTPRVAFPIVRRDAYESCGGSDATLPTAEHAAADLAIRLAAAGHRGKVLPDRFVEIRSGTDPAAYPLLASELLRRHGPLFERHFREAIVGREVERRRLEGVVWDPIFPSSSPGTRALDWGDLRRLEPVSRVWGLDRGLPVDRYYIAKFLEEHRADIRGRVLEVKDSGYTAAYGSAVERSDVVDIAPDNPSATIVADLSAPGSLPEGTWDCFVLTQTIHIIYDTPRVLANAARALAAGGVLLATLPCVSRLDYESGLDGDFWRFTPASAKRLFEEAFGPGNVEVEAYGSVLACSAFLQGIAAEELTREELDRRDPYFPLLLCVKAVKRSPAREG